jgi:hypothetical protein
VADALLLNDGLQQKIENLLTVMGQSARTKGPKVIIFPNGQIRNKPIIDLKKGTKKESTGEPFNNQTTKLVIIPGSRK